MNYIFDVYSHWVRCVHAVVLSPCVACVAFVFSVSITDHYILLSILCILGGSSGTAAYVAMQACKDFGLTKDQRCVVLLPDSIRNYMSVDFIKIILQIYKSLPILTLRNVKWCHEFFSQPPSSLFKNDYHVSLYNNAFWLLLISY